MTLLDMHYNLGNWKIFAVETGDFRLDGGAMMGSVPKVLWEKTNPSDDYNRIDLSLRCLLVDTGESCILIESGMGNKLNDKFKKMFHVVQKENPLISSLQNLGYQSGDITHVILTHLHFDHSGGATMRDEEGSIVPAFQNATYYISSRNWEAGLNPNPRDRASYLSENYACLQSSDQLKLTNDEFEIHPGITTIIVNGHTPGQQLIKIENSGSVIVFVADLIPLKSHLKLPWIMGYDLNAQLTLQEKTTFLKTACSEGWWLWFYHDPKTVMVKIAQDDKYYSVNEEILKETFPSVK